MSPEFVTELLVNSLILALMIASPMLVLGLIVGVAISIVQAATSVQEMTLTFIPKIVIVVLGLMYFLPWMIAKLTAFTINLITNMPQAIG
ncbi:flagellar biosynthesis protein FliQ [Desulfurispirillum indicum]|uniref:Flagellar biosynthetic protein FliQ n=1 Tax=Desulfurispirillum indicum (strain ATCC BAA-1389 / DSM 22839 / S5) TaxID=653733 RepID=E6W668_DESIS|nr:flagellar biosynthesis protein FliQ [Desulfurispirillum indicum]ADU66104.1 flagellar biosynthetic protein FliQ [Desulfurispirillum indicum S5]UCZ55510.1 flagellar biosynthesis protein FliQ [Desulfurispirillum indicum]